MRPGEVTYIPVKNVDRNPHNPRRLFDDEPMHILEESIRQVGVLVPITVYPKVKKEEVDPKNDRFIILDGERRWRCVQEIGRTEIPAIIVEKPDDVTNILTMFHIHNMREPWMLMPTALKLKTLMEMLHEENEAKLAELTKLTISQVRRCKILLSFPKMHQNLLLAPPDTRLKADFFIELQRIRGPALSKQMPFWINRGDEKCIDIILHKYLDRNDQESSTIRAVTEFRHLAEIYSGAVRTDKLPEFYEQMEKFLTIPSMQIADVQVEGTSFEKEYTEIKRSAIRLERQLRDLDIGAVSGDEKMIDLLISLSNLIKTKLEEALVVKR